jgi:lysozyme
MNAATRKAWTWKLHYRQGRLAYWRSKKGPNQAASVAKWVKLVKEAEGKLRVVGPPVSVNALGVDVSSYQGDVNWDAVKKSGHSFAICKTTESTNWTDPTWSKARVQALRKAGIKVGVYHFLRPQAGRSGAAEAKFFMQQAKAMGWGQAGDLRPVIDFEATTLSPHATLVYLSETVAEIKRLNNGRAPIIYTGGPFWDENTDSSKDNKGCDLWLAAYVQNPNQYLPAAWKSWAMWQYSSTGRVSGITGDCDVSHARKFTCQ